MTDREAPKDVIFEEEVKRLLAGRPRIYKMTKEGEEDFYFDSTDLLSNKNDFIDMRKNGWQIPEEASDELPAYLTTRLNAISEAGFESSGSWDYKKK